MSNLRTTVIVPRLAPMPKTSTLHYSSNDKDILYKSNLARIYTGIHQHKICPDIGMVINNWFHDPGGNGSSQVWLEYSFFTDPTDFLLGILWLKLRNRGPTFRILRTEHTRSEDNIRDLDSVYSYLHEIRIVSSGLCKRPWQSEDSPTRAIALYNVNNAKRYFLYVHCHLIL